MTIYTAEDGSGDIYLIASWVGLDRERFKEFVLDQVEKDGIPEPDRNISELDLCEWNEADFFQWNSPDSEPITATVWKEARFTTLYWTYPGVWSETHVTRMPPELAAEFWNGDGVDRTDPHHPEFHDLMAGAWDNREKGER